MSSSKIAKMFSGLMALVVTMTATICARADLLELTNGDHYRVTIISMNSSNIEFLSEIQGRVTLPRSKVANIMLHEVTPKPAATVNQAMPPVGAPLILSGTNASTNATSGASSVAPSSAADAVVRQLRQQGVDPKLIDQVQEQIFGKSSPEASQKFNELMGGLMTGRVSVQDIRAQAQNSINQIKAAKKELGGDAGDMLDSYLAILEKFAREADAGTPPPTPAPSK